MSYDVEGPDPVQQRSFTKPLRTAIVLGVLAVAVLIAGRWGWAQVTEPFGDTDAVAAETADASTPVCTPLPEAPPALPPPSDITVNVYNASGVGGAAGSTSQQLSDQGFDVGAVDNDPLGKRLDGVGEIRSSASAELAVQQLLRYVPGAEWVTDDRPGGSLDFAVGLGFNGVVTPEPLPDAPVDNTEDDIPPC